MQINADDGVLKTTANLVFGGKNIKFWLIYMLFGSCLFYFVLSITSLKRQRWFNGFTNLFLFISLGSICLFALLVSKCHINFWIFDLIYPGRETFQRYFLTVVNMLAMLFCFFALRRAVSLKGSFWGAKTGSESYIEIVYMASMIAPVLAFFFHYFSGRLSFESFGDYLTFQFSAMWFGHGFWAFLMGWTTFLYMLLIVLYALYLLFHSLLHPTSWLWFILLPAICVLVFISIYFSLLQLEEIIMTTLIPVAFLILGIIQSGLNRVEWVHTHDIQDKWGVTIGRGYTAKHRVGKKYTHEPDRVEPL
jgi:hypothetical protein